MNNNIENHPTILHQNDISVICRPLQKLNITYFCHVNIMNDKFSALANNPEFHRHYLENEYFNFDIHMAKSGLVKNYLLADAIEPQGKTLQMNIEASQFGAKHVFTIIENNKNVSNYYHFATNVDDRSINQTYLANIDVLKLFIMNFNHQVNRSKELTAAYNIRFGLSDSAEGFSASTEIEKDKMQANRNEIIHELTRGNKLRLPNGKLLTERQLTVLYWLHCGKTISEIATILGVTDRTVNMHMADIKHNLGCYTQFQMGEYFSQILALSPEWHESISKFE